MKERFRDLFERYMYRESFESNPDLWDGGMQNNFS